MVDYENFRIAYEITSTILVIILVRFMLKPYQLTGESRYLGLPLGFGFLGVTYALSAFTYYQPHFFGNVTLYIQLVLRSFAFVFLCVTYYFANKTTKTATKNTRWIWNTTLILLLVAFVTSFVLVMLPGVPSTISAYSDVATYVRIFNLVCIGYLCYRTFRSHIEQPQRDTLWIPLSYLFLGVSQYSLVVYTLDNSMSAWWGALAIRWIAFALLLYVAYMSFYSKKGRLNEKNPP
jgi:hypothetical protein